MIEKIKKVIWYVLEALIFIIILSCVWSYFNRRLDISEQNLKAAQGELVEAKLKNGNLLVSRDSYIVTLNEMEQVLDITKKEVKELQRQLDSKVAYISQIESNVKIEFIEVVKDSIVYVNNNPNDIVANFHYTDEWININGVSNIKLGEEIDYKTTLNNIDINTPLTVGLTNDYQIFVTTPNPYVNFSDINGAVIDKSKLYPKKKRFSWGFQLGAGVMYDIIDKDVAVGPYGGLGVEINF